MMTTPDSIDDLQPFLTVAPIRDFLNRRILLLHSDVLTNSLTTTEATATNEILSTIKPTSSDVLLYLHAGLATTTNTSLSSARLFRRAVDNLVNVVPSAVIALHVSFLTRTHASVTARFAGSVASEMYARLEYCDLVEDLERFLGIDSTLLGLRLVDLDYDEVMRAWVGRKVGEEIDPSFVSVGAGSSGDAFSTAKSYKTTLNVRKPLIDINAISFDGSDIDLERREEEEEQRRVPQFVHEP